MRTTEYLSIQLVLFVILGVVLEGVAALLIWAGWAVLFACMVAAAVAEYRGGRD